MLSRDGRSSTQSLVRCALFAALISIGAFIQIPVPFMDYFTVQFFFVLMAGLLLGSKLGATAVAVYVGLGLVGFPIFAAGGGINYILRPSFGYLLGFIAAAFVTGFFSRHTRRKGFWRYFCASLAGLVVTYAIGILYKYFILNVYLGTPSSWGILFLSCFPLDMPGDFVLCILAALASKRLVKSGIGEMKHDIKIQTENPTA